jgi:hypothetical protein
MPFFMRPSKPAYLLLKVTHVQGELYTHRLYLLSCVSEAYRCTADVTLYDGGERKKTQTKCPHGQKNSTLPFPRDFRRRPHHCVRAPDTSPHELRNST